MDKRTNAFTGENVGWRLETIIYIELLRRSKKEGCDIFYYKKHPRAKEVDFVVCKGNRIIQMYQVAYNITNAKTRKRELESLISASEKTGCKQLFLITDFERETVKEENYTIQIIPAYEWLLH